MALAGFLLVALTGLANQRSVTLARFDSTANSLTELLADNMVGSVRFGRAAGIEAAFAGLRQNRAGLLPASWCRTPRARRSSPGGATASPMPRLAAALPQGVALLDAAGITTVELAVRQSREAEPVGTLRTVWSHQLLDAAIRQAALRQGITALLSMLAMIGLLYGVLRRIAIHPLADDDRGHGWPGARGIWTWRVHGAARRDELGALARSLEVFREHMLKERELAAAQVEEHRLAAADKRDALRNMADAIETEIATAIAQIGRGAATLAETAVGDERLGDRHRLLRRRALPWPRRRHWRTPRRLPARPNCSAASIGQIGSQVEHSTAIVGRAVQAGNETRATIEALNEKVAQIGSVAEMIGEIAAQDQPAGAECDDRGGARRRRRQGLCRRRERGEATRHADRALDRGDHAAYRRDPRRHRSIGRRGRPDRTDHRRDQRDRRFDRHRGEQQGAATAGIARNVADTANAANEMTSRTTEVSAEARRPANAPGCSTTWRRRCSRRWAT